MVIWANWLTAISSAMGVTQVEAGIMISLIFTILSIFVVLIATKGKKPGEPIMFTALFFTVLFTFMGWYPVWVGSVLSLVVALLIASFVSRRW